MVGHRLGEPLLSRIEGGPARDGPGAQHPVDLKAKVVVPARGVVELDDEAPGFTG
jgi:hypothetical protein